jgi:hypothetical protein
MVTGIHNSIVGSDQFIRTEARLFSEPVVHVENCPVAIRYRDDGMKVDRRLEGVNQARVLLDPTEARSERRLFARGWVLKGVIGHVRIRRCPRLSETPENMRSLTLDTNDRHSKDF